MVAEADSIDDAAAARCGAVSVHRVRAPFTLGMLPAGLRLRPRPAAWWGRVPTAGQAGRAGRRCCPASMACILTRTAGRPGLHLPRL